MVFALGFLLAGLLALLFMPVLSRRAVRLATRRLSMLVPLSMAEVAAERDGVRAEHAATARRLEQKVDLLTRDKADAMAAAGREAGRAAAADAEKDALAARAATLQNERDAAVRAAHGAEAQASLQEQGLRQTLALADRRLAKLNAVQAMLAESEARSDERRSIITGLETRATDQDLRLRVLAGRIANLTRDLQASRTALEEMTRDRELARAEAALLAARRDVTQAEFDVTKAEVAALRAGLAARDLNVEGPRSRGADDLATLRNTIVTLAAEIFKAGQDRPDTS